MDPEEPHRIEGASLNDLCGKGAHVTSVVGHLATFSGEHLTA
ncbi:hypothetical protein ACIQHY_28455 [Streptomyces sp. NPDC092359]